MPILNVNEKDYEAKVTFKFNSLAKDKYYAEDKEGNKGPGINNIYEKLLNFDNEGLIAFWDCAVNHLKDRPNVSEIEEALDAVIEKDGDTEQLFKDCFQAMDQSGFFKLQAKKYWGDMEKMPEYADTEKEKNQMEAYVKRLKESKKALTA